MLDLVRIQLEDNYEFEWGAAFSSIPELLEGLKLKTSIPLSDLFSLKVEDYVVSAAFVWVDDDCVEVHTTFSKGHEPLNRTSTPIEIKKDTTLDDIISQLFDVLHYYLEQLEEENATSFVDPDYCYVCDAITGSDDGFNCIFCDTPLEFA